jgi:hypothetical protein
VHVGRGSGHRNSAISSIPGIPPFHQDFTATPVAGCSSCPPCVALRAKGGRTSPGPRHASFQGPNLTSSTWLNFRLRGSPGLRLARSRAVLSPNSSGGARPFFFAAISSFYRTRKNSKTAHFARFISDSNPQQWSRNPKEYRRNREFDRENTQTYAVFGLSIRLKTGENSKTLRRVRAAPSWGDENLDVLVDLTLIEGFQQAIVRTAG